jgi:peptidyl-prolyl cis-trans isomerase SurA
MGESMTVVLGQNKIIYSLLLVSLIYAAQVLAEEIPEEVSTSAEESPAVVQTAEPSVQAKEGVEVVLDMVVVSIDGDPFTSEDLAQYLRLRGETFQPQFFEHTPATMRILDDFITEKLLEKEAKESGLSAGDEEISTYVEEIKRQGGVSQEDFERLLGERGLTLEQYRTQVAKDIVRARLLGSKVRSKISVLDEDIERYLEEHPELRPESGTVRIKQIFVRYPELSLTHEHEDGVCREMESRVRSGENFETVGGEHYQDLGFVRPEELKDDLREAVGGLKAGETSAVIQSRTGCRIVLFVGESGEIAQGELRERVKAQLYEEQFREKAEKYIRDDLRKKYHVEIKV